MLTYILGGAILGAIIGYVITPGHFFWFVLGAACGYLVRKYGGYRF
ncbi:hypothetical protein [Acetonema longum]|uniref:DUF2273 domain-containing protein n=1 Tax=Acetonema longum DSM 6540 TaxID=1009370 RepID=F7NJY3_9FIRM|nr:hypothetical protein [Acetonema longum]EGO63630.1 hypothetical protein ALO_11964 [Acetonema longum DSM 6540]